MPDIVTHEELLVEANELIKQATALVSTKEATSEDHAKARKMMEDAQNMKERSKTLQELEALKADAGEQVDYGAKRKAPQNRFKTFGEYLTAIHRKAQYGEWDPRIKDAYIKLEDDPEPGFDINAKGWIESRKDLVENIGASGGFTVFPEFRPQMFQLSPFQMYVRERALVLPMRSRQVVVPVLDQTGTTAGQSNIYGGVIAKWTEEGGTKEETEPSFRQMTMTAHKLVVYTEASDELMTDSAVGLEALLTNLMSGSIANESDFAFIQGTGAGQPLGVVTATGANGPTLQVARQAAGAIGVVDVFNMLAEFQGSSPIWLAHQSTMPDILQLNGPAGNPSYVWIQNVREGMPMTLMGYPIFFIENCPTLGNEGDLILADWSKYVIGDRQTVTIDSSKHFRFQNDITAWRAVARLDGRPWLSAPLTLRDGATQVSPFVILDDAVAT